MTTVAERACRHLHALEWNAPRPRTKPCQVCTELAEAIKQTGMQSMTIYQDAPPREVVVVCVNCGGRGRSIGVRA